MNFRRRINRITAVLVCLAVTLLPAVSAAACVHVGGARTAHAVDSTQPAAHCESPAESGAQVQSCTHCAATRAGNALLAVSHASGELDGIRGRWLSPPAQALTGAVPAPLLRPPRGA